jgi:hypothetical protein
MHSGRKALAWRAKAGHGRRAQNHSSTCLKHERASPMFHVPFHALQTEHKNELKKTPHPLANFPVDL